MEWAWKNLPLDQLVALSVRGVSTPEEEGDLTNRIADRLEAEATFRALGPLYRSGQLRSLRSLAFILSNRSGGRSILGMDWLDDLLDHEDAQIRYYAVMGVQASGSIVHGQVTLKALQKLNDVAPVRLAALRLAALGSLPQIQTAIPLASHPYRESLTLLARPTANGVRRMLHGETLESCLIGLAAACRLDIALDDSDLDDRPELRDAHEWLAAFRRLPSLPRNANQRLRTIAPAVDED
jgi:hypothetical protein